MNYTIGQKLWFVPSGQRWHGEPRWLTITGVGRKWLKLDYGRPPYRADVMTLYVDGRGHTSPGNCYVDRDAYEAAAELSRVWEEFRRRVRSAQSRPAHLTVADIARATAIIFGDGEARP